MSAVVFDEQKYLIWLKFIKGGLATNSKFSKKSKTDVPLNSLKSSADVHPSSFISKILAPRRFSEAQKRRVFMNLSPAKISALVPYLKLYKVDGKVYTPFLFPSRTHEYEVSSIMNEGGRLQGAGLKQFSMAFEGKDTFTADKLIDCSLSFHVQNMKSFFEKPYPGYAPLAELITIKKPKSTFLIDPNNKVAKEQVPVNPKGLEIKADVGWSVYPEMQHLFTQAEIQAVDSTKMSLRLTLTDHTFNFTQEGTIDVSASYVGRLEPMFDSKSSDIFLNKGGKWTDTNFFKQLSDTIEEEKREAKADGTISPEEKKKIKKKKTTGLVDAYAKILERLDTSVKETAIQRLQLSISDEREYLKDIQGEKLTEKEVKTDPDPPPTIRPKNPNADDGPAINLSQRNINYVYLADLVESVLRILKENYANVKDPQIQRQIDTFRMILGTTALDTTIDSKSAILSIGELPISMRAYSDWFKNNIIKLGKSRFGFKSFIESMISDLVNSVLKKMNYRDAPIINENVRFGVVTLTTNHGHGNLGGKTVVSSSKLPSFLHGVAASSYDDDVDYIIFYSYEARKTSEKTKTGNEKKDLKDGVYHFFLGKDRGLIKEISFSKVNIQFRKEALITQSYSLFDELMMPYNARISMVGNNLFRPGSQIYINPSTIGLGDPRNEDSYAVRLGLGGYYSIKSVKTTFSTSGLETELDAIFTGWPENKSVSLVPGSEATNLVRSVKVQSDADVEKIDQPEAIDSSSPAFVREETSGSSLTPPAPSSSSTPLSSAQRSFAAASSYASSIYEAEKEGTLPENGIAPKVYSHEIRKLSDGRTLVTIKEAGQIKRAKRQYDFLFNSLGEVVNYEV